MSFLILSLDVGGFVLHFLYRDAHVTFMFVITRRWSENVSVPAYDLELVSVCL